MVLLMINMFLAGNLHAAISKLKEEIKGGVRMKDEAVVEELMKLMKTNSEANGSLMIVGNESSDTKNWMNSVQLWNVETKQVNLKNRFFFW